jgi:hypothetical protein
MADTHSQSCTGRISHKSSVHQCMGITSGHKVDWDDHKEWSCIHDLNLSPSSAGSCDNA